MFNEAHLHLLVNHVPVIGFAGALVFAAICLFSRNRTLHATLYCVVLASAAGMAAAFLTGEPAEDYVLEAGVPISHAHLSAHMRWASVAFYGGLAAGLLALVGLIATAKARTIAYLPAVLTFLLVAGINVAGGVTAGFGGGVRHTEVHSDGFSQLLESLMLPEELEILAEESAELGGGDRREELRERRRMLREQSEAREDELEAEEERREEDAERLEDEAERREDAADDREDDAELAPTEPGEPPGPPVSV